MLLCTLSLQGSALLVSALISRCIVKPVKWREDNTDIDRCTPAMSGGYSCPLEGGSGGRVRRGRDTSKWRVRADPLVSSS